MFYQVEAPPSVKPQLGQTRFKSPSYSILSALHRGQIIPGRRLIAGVIKQNTFSWSSFSDDLASVFFDSVLFDIILKI